MDINDLGNLENSVSSLLSLAKAELEENRLQQQRDVQIEEKNQRNRSQAQAPVKPSASDVEAI